MDKHTLLLIDWLDITATAGWEPAGEVEPTQVQTLGWLAFEDSKVIKVGNSLGEDGEIYGISAIPQGCVIGTTILHATEVSRRAVAAELPTPSLQHQQDKPTALQSV
jgi:hypothetical protein